MIRVAVDTLATRPPSTYRGFFEYTRLILENFRRIAPEFRAHVSAYVGTDFAREIAGIPASDYYSTVCTPSMNHLRRWRFGLGAMRVKRDGNQLLFATHAETVTIPGMPYVVMLHDVDFMRFRQYSPLYTVRLYAMHWLSAHSAARILTNSECSKRDIVHFLGVPPERVQVIYLGCKHEIYNLNPTLQLEADLRGRFKIDRNYILHHGTVQPRKNLVRLVKAYRQVAADSKMDCDLVIAGNYGWESEDLVRMAKDTQAPGRVVLTGFLEENHLAALVKGASLSIVPSLWEGFCFPMVESMACGVPTIVSNNSCFPEVSGGALRYFDAYSIGEIAETIYTVLQSPTEQERLRSAGVARAKEFSWDRCARETLQALCDVAKTNASRPDRSA